MKKSLFTAAFVMSLASTAAFAHHPAADIVDPEIYAMIDENVADTPHADLTFDDMGSRMDSDDVGEAMNAREEMSGAAAQLGDDVGNRDDVTMDAAEAALDTIDLLDNVGVALSE
ncbi:MAG: hypothetical protein EP315_06105 [Gammaproteobacteria bacterium]|nr:MAG: hypothetical protein EP315_06105 [Gammaproteobacteria bacterium]